MLKYRELTGRGTRLQELIVEFVRGTAPQRLKRHIKPLEVIHGRPEERATLTVLPAAGPAQNAFRTWGWNRIARTRSEADPAAPVADVLITALPVKY